MLSSLDWIFLIAVRAGRDVTKEPLRKWSNPFLRDERKSLHQRGILLCPLFEQNNPFFAGRRTEVLARRWVPDRIEVNLRHARMLPA